MNFSPIGNKGMVEGFCLVKRAEKKTSAKGDGYLDMTLGDSTGEINAKIWSYDESVHGKYETNDIVKVRGTVSIYRDSEQLRVEQIRLCIESDNVNPSDFVKTADYDTLDMYNELTKIAEEFSDKELSSLVLHMLEDNREKLLYWPAAFKLHHAIRGGLLMHTLSIVRICFAVASVYTFLNRDLLVSGAILHDIAKTTEYDVASSGLSNGYTVKGNLIGHLAEGAIMVNEAAKKYGISEDTAMLLEHMLLSHHGEPEFGVAVRPSFIEAEILSELDLMDARLYEMKEALSSVEPGKFTGKLWSMEDRKLYNHGKSDLNNETKLF